MEQRNYSESEAAAFLDVDGSSTTEQHTGAKRAGGFRTRHVLAALAGVAAVATCGTLLVSRSTPVAATKKLTARMLFESPDIHDVATENVMHIKTQVPEKSAKSRDEVRGLVKKTFQDLVLKMKDTQPDMWNALEGTELSRDQHDGIVHMMRFLKDPRVMRMGLDTAEAIQEANSEDEETLKTAIIKKLKGRKGDVQQLYAEAFPRQLPELATSRPGDGFKSVLRQENFRVLKTMRGAGYQKFTTTPGAGLQAEQGVAAAVERKLFLQPTSPYTAQSPYSAAQQPAHSWLHSNIPHPYQIAEEVLSIVGTAMAEADTLIRIVNPLEKMFPGGHDLHISPKVVTGIGAADFAFQMADCEMDAVADHMNPVEALGCPAMSGSAGFDMLREPLALLGILGDNNPDNGRQGNHAGGHAHQGVFDDAASGQEMKKEAEGHWPLCMFWGMHTCKPGTATSTTSSSPPSSTVPPPPPSSPPSSK